MITKQKKEKGWVKRMLWKKKKTFLKNGSERIRKEKKYKEKKGENNKRELKREQR